MAQQRYDEAVALFQKRYAAAPHAENLFAVAEALEHAARHEEASQAFSEFERQALKESELADNANHELVAYYNDYAQQPEKARRIAEQELARCHDAFTLERLRLVAGCRRRLPPCPGGDPEGAGFRPQGCQSARPRTRHPSALRVGMRHAGPPSFPLSSAALMQLRGIVGGSNLCLGGARLRPRVLLGCR